MGAYRNPGELSPTAAGVAGSLIAVWTTFVPCFFWIFLGAPYIESLRGRASLNAALSAITAAVVGVILNLSIWFALHVLFGHVQEMRSGIFRWYAVDVATLDIAAAALAIVAGLLAFVFHRGLIATVVTMAALGVAVKLLL